MLHYDAYAAGTNARGNGFGINLGTALHKAGFAVVGVSARGTGCSQGEFDPFDTTMGTDGHDAVEWIADQPWSDGRVGMAGYSFGGITPLLVAATRPPHLRGIAGAAVQGHFYRDGAYPGGLYQYSFPALFTARQKQPGASDLVLDDSAARGGDVECVQNYAAHERANASRENFIPTFHFDNPWADSSDGMWAARSPVTGFGDINVPVHISGSWQDEQLLARWFGDLEQFKHPNRVWVDVSNGNHARSIDDKTVSERMVEFLIRFVGGVDNGFEDEVPQLTIGMETAYGVPFRPAWSITRRSNLLHPTPRVLHLRAGGRLTPDAPTAPEAGDAYGYPLPSSSALRAGGRPDDPGQSAWKAPVPPGGSVGYTSDPLDEDLVVAGPGSLDLWLQTTGTDLDLQATITEVRRDGQELYVQRGWLRASHRKLDPARSTALRPYHTHRSSDAQAMPRLTPEFLRLEIFPFAHAFRKGSRVRVTVEAPTGHTGLWAFVPTGEPQVVTVLHEAARPSKLVLGALEDEIVPDGHRALPECDTLVNQPCRRDPQRGGP